MGQQTNLTMTDITHPVKPTPAKPCILVIFGMAGDLTKRSLLPALCHLGSAGLLNENFHIIGVAREALPNAALREQLTNNINTFVKNPDGKSYGLRLIERISMIAGNFVEASVYQLLKQAINALVANGASENCLFYFSTPPQLIKPIATELNQAGLLTEAADSFRRILVEKPFGRDLSSAQDLNKFLLSIVNEQQIFRIDHFLGKEMVRNLLALRFSNCLFESTWNAKHIDHVQITVAESLGVETRGNFYECAGALRDMIPNHLFQMLSLIAMEPPTTFSDASIQAEKLKVLRAMQQLTPAQVESQVVRGQYGSGKIEMTELAGYRAEQNVSHESTIETYVALKLFLNNPRWKNVPFYLRTGKRMPMYKTEISIQYKSADLFPATHVLTKAALPNLLSISIQPKESISLRFNTKIPGAILQLTPAKMEFENAAYFHSERQTGYETILYDCMNGDHLLFKTADMVETELALVQPILDAWDLNVPSDFPNYAAGTYGPKKADDLLMKDGRSWLL